MSLAQIEAAAVGQAQNAERPVQQDVAAIQRMAAEFESLLLNQLTASLNPKEDEDEAGLFTNSGGLGLSKQMFSEQLAKTMSQSGGIGLAEMIVGQVTHKTPGLKGRDGVRALAAARDIRAASSRPTAAVAAKAANLNEQYPDAIIISEASPDASGAPVANSSNVADQVRTAQASSNVAVATRPRRVHSIQPEVKTPRNLSSSTSVSSVPKLGEAHRPVSLHLPIRGAIRSVFGPRRDPINGRHRFHQGVDIAAPRGTPIEAAAAGTVVFSGRNKGYGNMVMIEHADGRRTLYAHAESLFVRAGDTVAAGQAIAAVGSTGHSTGPHLHFEVREGNRPLNPLTVLTNDFTLARR